MEEVFYTRIRVLCVRTYWEAGSHRLNELYTQTTEGQRLEGYLYQLIILYKYGKGTNNNVSTQTTETQRQEGYLHRLTI